MTRITALAIALSALAACSSSRSKECDALKTVIQAEQAALSKLKGEHGEGPQFQQRLEQAAANISAVALTEPRLINIRERVAEGDRQLALAIRAGQAVAARTFDQKPIQQANAARDRAVKQRGAAVEALHALCK